jgi:hypothetical protein
MIVSLSGCAANETLRKAEIEKSNANAAFDALIVAKDELNQAKQFPEQPPDCKKNEKSGVKLNDRLDAAVIKYDRALSAANARSSRCSEWYDATRNGIAADVRK